jgi:hydroxymethylbilane synthase
VVDTAGDRDRDTPLHELGGQGIFVKEVQAAVLDGRADAAVHSAKDLRSVPTDGLDIVAVPARADVRDGLVGSTLDGLPTGATVGTGSVRRRAQLAALRPDLRFAELRGNMHTRLERAAELDAVVVAAAALDRLDLAHRLAERLDPGVVVPQVGQGALAVECRSGDQVTAALLASVDDPASHTTVTAERAWLAELGSGCDLPVGAHATVEAGGTIGLVGLIATLDGRVVLRDRASGDDPVTVGRELAERQLARGGRRLLQPGAAATS